MAEILQPLRMTLEPVSGPPIPAISLDAGPPIAIGRGNDVEAQLLDPTVSRRHARIEWDDGRWLLADHGSRQGTWLNEVQLDPDVPSELRPNDLLRIGPWTFRVLAGGRGGATMVTTDDGAGEAMRVKRLRSDAIGSLAQHRLSLIFDKATKLNGAADETELAKSVLEIAISGTGFHRGAMLKALGDADEVEVMGYLDLSDPDLEGHTFSRSLIREASTGCMACLLSDQPTQYGQSIADLNIHSAMCCPITIGEAIVSYLYLDAREDEARVQQDAAEFCQALSRFTGLAMANILRLDLERRQQRMELDFLAASEAQQCIVPPESGAVGPYTYSARFIPTRGSGGDLYDIVELADRTVALSVGDVSGKGIGAAFLMAAAQSFLHAALLQHRDPAVAVTELNRYITQRSALNRFLTLWVGVFDAKRADVTCVDAGHGHWVVRKADGKIDETPRPTCGLVGIAHDSEFTATTFSIDPGDRIIVFSDGIVEQQSPDGEEFSMGRVHATLAGSTSTEEDVTTLFKAVTGHAGLDQLKDDTTVVSIAFTPGV